MNIPFQKPCKQRLFYPDYPSLVTGLHTIKENLPLLAATPDRLRRYLTALYANACRLGEPICTDSPVFSSHVGGMADDAAVLRDDCIFVQNDNELKKALDEAKSGDVICIQGDAVIDMSDWILGGDTNGFTLDSGKIKYEMVIPEGVTLMGERGSGDCGGAIIKVSSYTDIAMRLKKNARVTGVCIQGPDGPVAAFKCKNNHSRGILLDGDGARIDNCEIAGFFLTAIVAGEYADLSVDHCYIHHILGGEGVVFACENASLTAQNNLYAHIRALVSDRASGVKLKDSMVVGLSDVVSMGDFSSLTLLPPPKDIVLSDLKPVPFSVLSGSYYPSTDDAPFVLLREVLASSDDDICEKTRSAVDKILSGICSLTNYLPYLNRGMLCREIEGEIFGARGDEKGPIGGGAGYYKIYSEKDATAVVTDECSLKAALENANDGDVIFIPSHVFIDFSDAHEGVLRSVKIEKSITLCSDRGAVLSDGSISTGAFLSSTYLTPAALFDIFAEKVRFSGLCIQGPDPADHDAHHTRAFLGDIQPPLSRQYYYNLQNATGINVWADGFEIDNCEISGFSCAAILLKGKGGKVPTTGIEIHHCYIHHNRLKGLGYGTAHGKSYSRIYCNLYNYNRHSIAGGGDAESGYYAYNNIEMGTALSANCDMHGGGDRKDGTQIAGEYCYIYNNTFLGKRPPYNVRGIPTKERTFHHNIVYRPREEYETALTHNRFQPDFKLENAYIGKNIWGVRDGDGVLMDESFGK